MKDTEWEENYGLVAWLFLAYILRFHFSVEYYFIWYGIKDFDGIVCF